MILNSYQRYFNLIYLKCTGAVPVAHVDNLTPEKLGKAESCAEERLSDDSVVFKVTGVPNQSKTVTILVRGSNGLVKF